MELSDRLKLVVSFVEQGAMVADVGTDHGYVPIYLVREGIAAGAIAIDVNRGPLMRAREHIEAHGLTGRIRTRLGDGLAALDWGEADTLIMAGMGSPLMRRILTEGMELARTMKRLILSPQSELAAMREFLEVRNFTMLDEAMVEEDGKFYTVLCACPGRGYIEDEKAEDGGIRSDNAKNAAAGDTGPGAGDRESKMLEWRYGKYLLEKKSPVLQAYLHREQEKYRQVLKQLDGGNSPEQQARKREVERELALMEKAFWLMKSPEEKGTGENDESTGRD